ncbi:MAG: PAS domain S-box protein [Candidatus Hydrogenedentes bacterium]|nr:PAS domain S-box protein [Candidatus Hydrogenedentota bacterium]
MSVKSRQRAALDDKPIVEMGQDGIIRHLNEAAKAFYGTGDAVSAGTPIHGLFLSERGEYAPFLERALRGEYLSGLYALHKSAAKDYVRVEYSLHPVTDRLGSVTGLRLLVQRQLDESPQTLQVWEHDAWVKGLVETAVDAIFAIDEHGHVEYLNSAAQHMFQYDGSEILGKNIRILMPNPYSDRHNEYLRRYIETGVRKIIGIGRDVVCKRKDNTTFPAHLSVSEVRLEGRRVFTGILRNISAQYEAQAEQNRLLGELQERNKKITCLYSVGEVLRAAESEGEMLEKVVHLIRPACFRPQISKVRLDFDEQVYECPTFTGSRWMQSFTIHVGNRSRGKLCVAYMEDLSEPALEHFLREDRNLFEAVAHTIGEAIERREAEAQVIQASKLASIGELAAGVGHEINNPINGIINCADLLMKHAAPGTQTFQFAQLARSEADRIATIVRNLLTFSRQEKEQHSLARICDVVTVTLSLCKKKIEKSYIQLQVDVPDTLPRIKCRSERLQQVLMNLIINAIHALDDRFSSPDPGKVLNINGFITEEQGKDYLCLEVLDRGAGIAPSIRERLFDPFFTTKGRDRGTGLGLSVSDGIVKDHGGYIRVESEVNDYTSFKVFLPLDNAWKLEHELPGDSNQREGMA